MFYYLFYNSSFPFIVENRLFSTILYGSILYILTHAILNHCDIAFLNIICQYYWVIFSLDIISFSYSIFKSSNEEYYEDGSNQSHQSNQSNSFNVSFNLLKNKINTLLDRKNDLTITPTSDKTSFQHIRIPSQQQHQQTQQQHQQQQQQSPPQQYQQASHIKSQEQKLQEFDQSFEDPIFINNMNPSINPISSASTSNKFSTPITQLKKQNNQNNTNQSRQQPSSSSSTPISLIREKITVPELTINEDNNNYAESMAGSDVGSVMDLDDFEKSL
jgi:hypothetical protein